MVEQKASIIVPIYNAEQYLDRCIHSILDQNYSNFEIILINDGSSDNSLTICENFARKHPNIKLINQKNRGVSAARNKGLEHATGNLILFVDADDYVEPTYVQVLTDGMSENGTDLCMCGIFYESEEKYVTYEGYAFDQNIECLDLQAERIQIDKAFIQSSSGIFSLFNKVFKKRIIDENQIKFSINKSHAEDFEFCIKYVQKCKTYTFLHKCLYHYVKNTESITNTFHLKQLEHHIDWLTILFEHISEETVNKYQKDIYRTTLYEINDYLIRTLRGSLKLKYRDIAIDKHITDMVNKLNVKEVKNKSGKLLLISLKCHTLSIYKIIYACIGG